MKIGDVVQLKGGGPQMTITAVGLNVASVTWFVSGQLKSEQVPKAALKPAGWEFGWRFGW